MHISPLPALCNVVKTLSFNSSLHFTIFQKGNGGVDTYSVGITITISCFWHFLTQFVHNCSYDNGCFSLCQIFPEISVEIQMGRSVSVSSDRNIRDHLCRWSTYFGWNVPTEIRRSIFDKPVLCPN